MNKFLFPILVPIAMFSLELCDTAINLNDPVKQKWGAQSEKVFNVQLQTYDYKTPQEICKIFIDPSEMKIVKLQKRNALPSVPASYPSTFQYMQFDFGELSYKDRDQPKQYLKTQSFSDFSETNMNFIDVIFMSNAVYKYEKTGFMAMFETRCAKEGDECITTFILYSGKYLNKDRVQNKLFKNHVEKEINNVESEKEN